MEIVPQNQWIEDPKITFNEIFTGIPAAIFNYPIKLINYDFIIWKRVERIRQYQSE